MMDTISVLFFPLLRIAIGNQEQLPRVPTAREWEELYLLSKKQALLGICFAGVQKLSINHPSFIANLSEPVRLQWMAMAAKIQQRNEFTSHTIGIVRKHFAEEGFDMVLLKGQGNLCNYAEGVQGLRMPGDIDAWIMPKNFATMSLHERMRNDEIVLRHFWKQNPSIRHCYIHINDSLIDGIDVEVHYRPSYINAPWRNHRFQKWMTNEASKQLTNVVKLPGRGNVEVAIPTWEFNVVYQLSHLYRHIFDDGLGLRQVMDYYWLLTNSSAVNKDFCPLLKHFGMLKFAGAIMYILKETFLMDEKYMICPVDEKRGRFLLEEIMLSGNFGHYDERQKIVKHENGVQRLLRRQKRNMRFFWHYTEEVLCVPIYRIYQEWWRLKMNILCK